MLRQYKHFVKDLLRCGEGAPTWDFFMNECISVDGKAELSMLIQSVCGPYSIPEYAIEAGEDVIPVIMYDPVDKGFKIQYEATTTPIMIYDLDTWLDSILAFWHDASDRTDAELEKLAKGFVCHSVNSYFTGNTEPYVVEKHCEV